MHIMSTNFAKTLVWKHEFDVKLWRRKERTPNTNDHHIPLNELPPWKFSAYATGSMDWTMKDNMVNGLFFCAATPYLCKQERECPTPVWRRLSRTQAVLEGSYRGVSAGVQGPLYIPLVSRPVRRTSAVVVRWTDELLCGGYKWVSTFEIPCIPARWTGERWVEQTSRLHGTACLRQCGSFATKLVRFDAWKEREVVCWCGTQASSHNSQCVVDGLVSERFSWPGKAVMPVHALHLSDLALGVLYLSDISFCELNVSDLGVCMLNVSDLPQFYFFTNGVPCR